MNCAKKLELKLKPSSVMNKTKWRVGVDVVVIWSADISFSRKASASADTNRPDLCLGWARMAAAVAVTRRRRWMGMTVRFAMSPQRSAPPDPITISRFAPALQFDRARARARSQSVGRSLVLPRRRRRARAGGRHCVTWWGG